VARDVPNVARELELRLREDEFRGRAHVRGKGVKVSTTLPYARRCDGAVLYLSSQDQDLVRGLVRSTYRSLRCELHSLVPALTKELGPGLGMAEDLDVGQSFGLHRCGLLAEAMVSAWEERIRPLEDQLRLVKRRFDECGLCFDRPYLGERSINDYEDLRLNHRCRSNGPHSARPFRTGPLPVRPAFLDVAREIGRQLSATAVWDRNRCTWIGPKRGAGSGRAAGSGAYSTLGPNLYAGTSGAALFLAQLYSVTGDDHLRRTAHGAVRHALCTIEDVPPNERLGLYTGWTGVALAATRVAALLTDEALVEKANQLIRHCECEMNGTCGFDLLSGTSGAIIALLALDSPSINQLVVDFALRLGQELSKSRFPGRFECFMTL
jgi:HopA1 effector protein family/Lanthionine synthetase C-like protein